MSERVRFIDTLYMELQKTFEQVREPGKSALVIFIEEYAHSLSISSVTLRKALVSLHNEGRIFTRKMSYPDSIPEAWEIVFLDQGGQS